MSGFFKWASRRELLDERGKWGEREREREKGGRKGKNERQEVNDEEEAW